MPNKNVDRRGHIPPSSIAQLPLPKVGQRRAKPAADNPVPVFEVGDVVHWASQAQGVSKTKEGVVQAIVPAGQRPDRERFPDLYKNAGAGWGRPTASYVVRVGRSRHYWPNVKHLRRGAAPNEAGPGLGL